MLKLNFTGDWYNEGDVVGQKQLITIMEDENCSYSPNVTAIYTNNFGKITYLPRVIPEEGFKFVKWVDSETGENVIVGQTLTNQKTIKPVFEEAEGYVKIEFRSQDEGVLDGKTSVYVKNGTTWKDVKKPLVVPNEGYIEADWYNEIDTKITDNYVFSKNRILTVHYEKLMKVTFVTDGNGKIDGKEFLYVRKNSTFGECKPNTTPNEGYILKGYYIDNVLVEDTTTIMADQTITVRFKKTTIENNWIVGTLPGKYAWKDIEYGNGKFVAIATGTDVVAYSEDGLNWYESKLPESNTWGAIAFGNGKFVALVTNRNTNVNKIAISTNGADWSLSTIPSAKWADIAYGNGNFVAVSDNKDPYYSSDGTNWTVGKITSNYWGTGYRIIYANGCFLAIDDDVLLHSTSGHTFDRFYLSNYSYIESLFGSEDLFFISKENRIRAYSYSKDITKWYDFTGDQDNKNCPYGSIIAYGNDKFVSVSNKTLFYHKGNVSLYSENGFNWKTYGATPVNSTWQKIIFADGKFVCISTNDDKVIVCE